MPAPNGLPPARPSQPDLINVTRKPLWLFDLDNTLHDASHAIFPAIHDNMNRFIARTLAAAGMPCDAVAVDAVRDGYWRRYGATLIGMVRHHQVHIDDFLRDAHAFDDLAAMIRTERGLARILRRLPGKKILLTNAPYRYSRDVVRHLGLHRHFSQHIAIESMRVHGQLRPKPSKILLRRLLKRERTSARRCILVEDTAATLKGAKALGMHTVLVTRYAAMPGSSPPRPAIAHRRHAYVDVKIRSIAQLPTWFSW